MSILSPLLCCILVFVLWSSSVAYARLAASLEPLQSEDITEDMGKFDLSIVDFIAGEEELKMRMLENSTNNVRLTYNDGEGRYVGSDEVKRSIGVKCWSDYFVVSYGHWYGPWYKASGNLYCRGTSECSIAKMAGHETCQTWSVGVSGGIADAFVSFSVQVGFSYETCNTGTDTSQCTWNDMQCHCIWTQQEMVYHNGYKRRRCNRGKGDYTEWMQDMVHDAPTRYVNYGCGSKCSD